MDQATTSTMDNKKPAPRPPPQNTKIHTQDHKEVNSKKSNGSRRQSKQEWERDGVSGNGGGGRVKASNGGAGASAGRGGWGRSAHRATRNREKEGGQVGGGHRGEWSHDGVDDYDFFSRNVPHRSGHSKHPSNITDDFSGWWGQSGSRKGNQGPNSNWRGSGQAGRTGGGRSKQSWHGGGAGVTKITNSKARFLQARCQFVVNPRKEAQHMASSRVPVGCSVAAPATVKTGPAAATAANSSSLVCAPADHPSQVPLEGAVSDEGDDPDALVDWGAVEEVLVHMTQPTHCPVCLYPPVAPQVTKCGHIYCYPCILHYLALSDKKWRACPICYEMVVRDDLKSAVCIVHPDYSVGSTISMVLMKRQRHSMQPAAVLPPQDYSPHSLARKIMATRTKVLGITDREQSALEVQMATDGNEPEACFIEQALALIKERKEALGKEYLGQDYTEVLQSTMSGLSLDTGFQSDQSVAGSSEGNRTMDSKKSTSQKVNKSNKSRSFCESSDSDKTATSSPPLPIPRSLASSPLVEANPLNTDMDNYLMYCRRGDSPSTSSSSSDGLIHMEEELYPVEEASTLTETAELQDDVKEINEGSEQLEQSEVLSARESECLNFDLEREVVGTEETVMSASSEHAVHASRVVASPKITNNAPKSTYYFYQASDGSHVYLHSINMAMLRNQYGSEENCPPTVTATIVEKDYFLMDENLRNRFKALRHLPLCCAFETVELSLQSPLVSHETLSIFKKRLSDRQQLRNSRAKEENLIERRNLEQQEKEFSSSLFTRVYSATSTRVYPASSRQRNTASISSDGGSSGLNDFPDIASGDSGRPPSTDGYSSPELATSPPADTPRQQQQQHQFSFAKMVRVHPNTATTTTGGGGGGTAGVVWPSLGRQNTPSVGTAPTRTGAWGSSSSQQSTVVGASGRPSLTACASGGGPSPADDDAVFNVPDYSQTFSQGFDLSLQAAEAAAAAARQTGAEGRRGKKGKKKTKQVLLFSSGR